MDSDGDKEALGDQHIEGRDYVVGFSEALQASSMEQKKDMFATGMTGAREVSEGVLEKSHPQESAEQLRAKLAALEQVLKDKTTMTLAKSQLVQNFQQYKEDAKVKNWQQVHQFSKVNVAGIKLEAEQIKKENQSLNQELTRMRRALEKQRKEKGKEKAASKQ